MANQTKFRTRHSTYDIKETVGDKTVENSGTNTEVVSKYDYNKPYFMSFTEGFDIIQKLRSCTDRDVLYLLSGMADIDTGMVSLNAMKRRQIMEKMGLKKQALSRSIRTLIENGILEKHKEINPETGEILFESCDDYDLNPLLTWRGNLAKWSEKVSGMKKK